MSIRKILVPLSGNPGDATILGTAMTVARNFEAQIVGMFTRPDPTDVLPYLGDGVSGQVIEEVMQAATAGAESACGRARMLFTDMGIRAGIPLARDNTTKDLPSLRFIDVTGRRDDLV